MGSCDLCPALTAEGGVKQSDCQSHDGRCSPSPKTGGRSYGDLSLVGTRPPRSRLMGVYVLVGAGGWTGRSCGVVDGNLLCSSPAWSIRRLVYCESFQRSELRNSSFSTTLYFDGTSQDTPTPPPDQRLRPSAPLLQPHTPPSDQRLRPSALSCPTGEPWVRVGWEGQVWGAIMADLLPEGFHGTLLLFDVGALS